MPLFFTREANTEIRCRSCRLNSIGIENPGLEGFLEIKAPILAQLPCAVIVSVEGEDVREFCELVEGVSRSGVAHAIEVNISCPNVGPHGMRYSTDADMAREVMTAIRFRNFRGGDLRRIEVMKEHTALGIDHLIFCQPAQDYAM